MGLVGREEEKISFYGKKVIYLDYFARRKRRKQGVCCISNTKPHK